VTLLSAALLSNLSSTLKQVPRVPTKHFLYDWCWSKFLPAALVFALLSSSVNNSQSEFTQKSQGVDSKVMRNCIQGMAIPFFIGCLGSVCGCMVSYFSVPLSTSLSPTKSTITSAILAGCLCASYIGGTVNFFAAGRILTPLSNHNDLGNAFGSMAAADLVVMAMYFTMLSAASKSLWLQKLFPSRTQNENTLEGDTSIENTDSLVATNDKARSSFNNICAISIAISIALSSVSVASRLEKKVYNQFNIPGTMCAFLAGMGLLYNQLIAFGLHVFRPAIPSCKSLRSYIWKTLHQIHIVAPNLCDLSFFLLFASVGTTANVSSAVLGGPMALVFATLALLVHCLVLLSGTVISSKIAHAMTTFGCIWWPQPTWQEVLTASNAAIGGPSTAAAFAAGLAPSGTNNGLYCKALVLSATIYGVLGYAVGTSTGVYLTKMLIQQ
jgi:uncharacterized membrane protein